MLEDDKSRIDKLRDVLYSRKIKIRPSFVLDLHGHKSTVEDKWTTPKVDESVEEKEPGSFSKKIFWFASIFFIISMIVAVYVYINGSNLISASNIKIDVLGPSSVKAGEETLFDVSITNNNDTTLEIADLLLEYPEGTRSASDKLTPMPHDRVAFGDIKPGQTVHETIKAVLFGEEGKPVHIGMTLEYRIPNSMSVFTKETAYEGLVGTSPLTVAVEALKEVNANQDYSVKITITSNSSEIAKDIILTGNLPFGYDVATYSPDPIAKTTTWSLGDIEPRGTRVIVIKGKMYGDHNEERFFKFIAGVKDSKNQNKVGAPIASVTQAVTIKEPFIGVALSFDRTPVDNYIAESDSDIGGVITFKNNLDVPVYDITIEAKVSSPLIDLSKIKTQTGFYDSNAGSIRWNKSYQEELASILPKNGTGLDFKFATYAPSSSKIAGMTNPEIAVDVTVHAKRRLETGVPEDIISTIHKSIKVLTSAHLSSQIVHTVGPIENQGEIPPQVGKKTTYTVIWAITNTFNELAGGKVVAKLPDYVSWENLISPSTELVSYNPDSREVTWNVGGVGVQTKNKPAVRQVAFQVGLTPSLGQINLAPRLIDVANFSANDTFTNIIVTDKNDALNTELKTDPGYEYGQERVVAN